MKAITNYSAAEGAAGVPPGAGLEELVDTVFSGRAWHGASLYGTLRRLSVEQALWENREGYSAWKIALHCAYWKHRAATRVAAAQSKTRPARFPRSPADFPDLPQTADLGAWKEDLALLRAFHERLLQAIRSLSWSALTAEEQNNCFRTISGAAAHDAYHTGMIRNMGVPGL